MEKYKKKDMLEAVNLLFHVNDSVLKNAKANKKEDIIEALSQCQDVALALGNYLESLGEAGENFVHILEDYCENLYQMSLIFSNENLCRKLSKKIKKQLSSDCFGAITGEEILETMFYGQDETEAACD